MFYLKNQLSSSTRVQILRLDIIEEYFLLRNEKEKWCLYQVQDIMRFYVYETEGKACENKETGKCSINKAPPTNLLLSAGGKQGTAFDQIVNSEQVHIGFGNS